MVLHFFDARGLLGDLLGGALFLTRVDRAAQRDLAVLHLDRDFGGIDVVVVHQTIRQLLLHAIVGTLIALRSATHEAASLRSAAVALAAVLARALTTVLGARALAAIALAAAAVALRSE